MTTDKTKIPTGNQEAPAGSAASNGAKPPPLNKEGGFTKWAVWLIVALIIIGMAGVAVGIVFAVTGGEKNHNPSITSLTADPDSLASGEHSIVTCVASDSDGDTLTYSWSLSGGSISEGGPTVTWTAPSSGGTFTITVIVDDGNGGTTSEDVDIISVVVPTLTPTSAPTPTPTTAATPTSAPTSTPTLAPIPTPTSAPIPNEGSIDIKSNPAGAKVYIDGSDTGIVTPYLATHIPEGTHVVKLVYPHYEWRSGSVTVHDEETADISWTLDYSPTQTVTMQPDAAAGKDSYVFESDPSSNRGTSTEIISGGLTAYSMCRAYIQFDLSSIPSSAVVTGTGATLSLFYERESSGAVVGAIGIFPVLSAWDEAIINWDNQPALAATVSTTTTVTAPHTDTFVNWYIADLAQAWISGTFPNQGMALIDTDETTAEGHKGFYSSDHGTSAENPKLTIQYYDPAP